MPSALLAPIASRTVGKSTQALVTTGQAAITGIPCAMFYGLYVVSPVSMTSLVTVAYRFEPLARQGRLAIDRLSASQGAPGPHDFTVRNDVDRRATSSASIASPPHVS